MIHQLAAGEGTSSAIGPSAPDNQKSGLIKIPRISGRVWRRAQKYCSAAGCLAGHFAF